MSNFCTHCGSPSNGAAFCSSCGADLRASAAPASTPQPATAPSTYSVPQPAVVTPPVAAATGMSTGAKVGIAFLVVFVVFCAAAIGGVVYVAHRVKQKVAEVKSEYLGGESGSTSSNSSSSRANSGSGSSGSAAYGDPCRYLSVQEVSKAVGVPILAAKADGESCAYIATGNAADMTAKHVAAIGASKGADAQQQNLVQNFAGAIFKSSQEQRGTTQDDGTVPILVISVRDNGLEQMKLNHGIYSRIGGATQNLPGVGDEAFDIGNAMIMARKGDKLIQMMYTTCPCALEALAPLARKLADGV